MARIAGVDLPNEKRVDIGLTYIFGIGRANVVGLLEKAKVDPATRVKDLSEDEVNRLAKAIDGIMVEGDLQREVGQNIRRLEDIGTYRGLRHRSNGRTRRGKRKTVGTVRKEAPAAAKSAA